MTFHGAMLHGLINFYRRTHLKTLGAEWVSQTTKRFSTIHDLTNLRRNFISRLNVLYPQRSSHLPALKKMKEPYSDHFCRYSFLLAKWNSFILGTCQYLWEYRTGILQCDLLLYLSASKCFKMFLSS